MPANFQQLISVLENESATIRNENLGELTMLDEDSGLRDFTLCPLLFMGFDSFKEHNDVNLAWFFVPLFLLGCSWRFDMWQTAYVFGGMCVF
jgi:hypothetical protein